MSTLQNRGGKVLLTLASHLAKMLRKKKEDTTNNRKPRGPQARPTKLRSGFDGGFGCFTGLGGLFFGFFGFSCLCGLCRSGFISL